MQSFLSHIHLKGTCYFHKYCFSNSAPFFSPCKQIVKIKKTINFDWVFPQMCVVIIGTEALC